jgi:hypothetical protein
MSASFTLLREARLVDAIFQPLLSPQKETIIPTRIPMTSVDVYAWITFIHEQTFLLSDFIKPGNRELLFGSYNAIDLQRGRQEHFGAFREAGDI